MSVPKISRREAVVAGIGLALGYGLSRLTGGTRPSENFDVPVQSAEMASNSPARTLADDPSRRKSEYDVLVIGSGYGASVIAARIAGKAKSLAIFERGREWLPGQFPNTAFAVAQDMRGDLNPLGLLDRTSERSDLEVICASGLGGTSLINAAISIRPEPTVFQEPQWPREIRAAAVSGELEKYYQKAESVLKPKPTGRLQQVAKAMLHKWSAAKKHLPWGALNLNITDHSGVNEYGVVQAACTMCGDCCAGCNVGAKNTLTTNYLPMAKKAGAEIYTGLEILKIEKTHDGYLVEFADHMNGGRIETVRAKQVVLGAGSKGSTGVLLRSRAAGLKVSPKLGTRLSANGDVMGFIYNTSHEVDILGFGDTSERRTTKTLPGPLITSYVDYRSNPKDGKVDNQFLILDGVVPTAFKETLAKGLAAYALTEIKMSSDELYRVQKDLYSLNVPADGALNHSMLFFACGHDSSAGTYYLADDGEIETKWPNVTQGPTFRHINEEISSYTKLIGGTYIENPRSTVFGGKIQATHPLGGCPMADDIHGGVVDHLGRVFNPAGGVYPGLYVVDASILPRSLAATPLLTITALAERIADHFTV